MKKFGSAEARGRRAVPRAEAPLVVTLATGAQRYTTTLLVVSRTGARLIGAKVPPSGEEVLFRAGRVEALGEVVWSDDRQCAVAFDRPVSAAEVGSLRSLAAFVSGMDTAARS